MLITVNMALSFVRGHQVYYNFIKPHEALYGVTPAKIAGVKLDLREKKWENLLMQSLKYHNGGKNEKI